MTNTMQSIKPKRPYGEEQTSSEIASKRTKTLKVSGLDVSVKEIDSDDLKICNLNPLFPETTKPLCFSIDRAAHEELRSSGLEVRIVKKHKMSSYMNIRRKSTADARGALDFFRNINQWVKDELPSKGVDNFFFKYPYYIIELNVNNKAFLESHLRHLQKDYSKISSANEGESLGFVSFNENTEDKDWIDVHGLYILPKYQKLGLGTFLVRAVVYI